MSIKKIFFLLVAALLASCEETGCESNPTPKTEIEKLPPITQTGENTFGFLLNGAAKIPRSSTASGAFYQSGILSIWAGYSSPTIELGIGIYESANNNVSIDLGIYDLTSYPGIFVELYKRESENLTCTYIESNILSGTLTITKFDKQLFILSGLFEFTAVVDSTCDTVKIENGRFDLQYTP
jgi:hypothetical protein